MSQGAHLNSLDALREAKAAVMMFAQEVSATLSGVDSEVMRMGQWLQQDRPAFWKAELRRREDAVGAAKLEIERKIIAAAPDPASTVLERKVLEAAKRRVDSAREKQENAKRWAAKWDREALMYKSSCAGLSEFASGDVLHTQERLEKLMALVDQYTKIAAPTSEDAGVSTEAQAGLDDGASASESMILLREDDVPGLRARVPIGEERERLVVAAPPEPFVQFAALRERDADELKRLELTGELPDPDSKIVLSWKCLAAPAVFVTRALRPEGVVDAGHQAVENDSGWSIGPAHDPNTASGWLAVRLGDVLAARPEFEAVFRLAPGSIVVMGGGSVRWVFNALDRNVWAPHA